jgi:hypothetical protein
MALAYSVTIRNNMLTEIVDASSAGFLRIYDGTRPATGGAATTLLAELTLSGPSGTVSGGFLAFSTITADSSANASGTATWFRVVAANGSTHVIDGNIGTSGSDLNLNTLAIVASANVSVTSFTITEGNP